MYKRVNTVLVKIHRPVTGDIRLYEDVAHGNVVIRLVLCHHTHKLVNQLRQGIESVRITAHLAGHPDSYDDIRTHGLAHIHRKIVEHTAVHQYHVPHPHRREHSRDSHTCTDSLGKQTVVEDHLVAADHIGGHTGIRYGHLIEIYGVLIAEAQGIDKTLNIVAVDESRRQ